MKKIFNHSLFILGLLMAITITSCTKEGEIGPIGPQGSQGEAGPQGEQGPKGDNGQDGQDGQDGEDGNANIIYSEWFTSGGAWTKPGSDGYDAYFDRAAPGVTQDIIDSGIVLSYANITMFSGGIKPLPFTTGNGVTSLWNYFITDIGNIRFIATNLEHDDRTFVPSRFIEFRYVIVPGGQLGAKGAATKNELKKMSYQEVMEYFGLEY